MEEKDLLLLEGTLKSLSFSSYLKLDNLKAYADSFEELQVKKGAKILGKGKVGSSFVIVATGKVSVWQEDENGREIKTGELMPGSYFGELSLLLGQPRIATFRADEDTMLYFVKKKYFLKFFASISEVKTILESKAQERLTSGYGGALTADGAKKSSSDAADRTGGNGKGSKEEVDDLVVSLDGALADMYVPEGGAEAPQAEPRIEKAEPESRKTEPEREKAAVTTALIEPKPADVRKPSVESKPDKPQPREKIDRDIPPLEEALALIRGSFDFSDEDVERLRGIFKPMAVRHHTRLLVPGNVDELFYLIARGKVNIREEEAGENPISLGPGEHFGELSLLFDVPRNTFCFTEDDSVFYTLTKNDFLRYLVPDPEGEEAIRKTSKEKYPDIDGSVKKLEREPWVDEHAVALTDDDFKDFKKAVYKLKFQNYLKEEDIGKFIPYFRKITVPGNTVIQKEGIIGQHFFIVFDGKVKSRTFDEQSNEMSVDEYFRGDFWGEESILFNNPVYADIVSDEDSIVFVMKKRDFFRHFLINQDVEAAITLSCGDKLERAKKLVKPPKDKKEAMLPLTEDDFPLLTETLEKLDFFQYFTDKNIEVFKKLFKKIQVSANTKILGKGKKGNAFIMVGKGKVSVRTITEDEIEVEQAVLFQGGFFGEESLLLDKPRGAEFWATEDSVLFYMNKKNFLKYFVVHAEIEKSLKAIGEYRTNHDYRDKAVGVSEKWIEDNSIAITERYFPLYHDTMKKFEFSKYMKESETIGLRNYFKLYPVQKGTRIIRLGSAGDFFFILARGKIDVKKYAVDGSEITVNELKPGDFFGEVSLMKGIPRDASCLAAQNCILFVLNREDFLHNLLSNSMVKQFMMKRSDERRIQVLKKKSEEKPGGQKKAIRERVILAENLEQAMQAVRNLSFFNYMDRNYLQTLLGQLTAVQVPPGSRIRVDEDKALHIIASGRVVISERNEKGEEIQVQRLDVGDVFGENELLEETPIPREYYADGTAVLFMLADEHFKKFMDEDFGSRFYIQKSMRVKNDVHFRRFPKRLPASERITLGGSLSKNGLALLTMIKKGVQKRIISPVKSLAGHVIFAAKNRKFIPLLLAIAYAEANYKVYITFKRMSDYVKFTIEKTKRAAVYVVQTNVANAKTSVTNWKEKKYPPESRRCDGMNLAIFTRQMGIMMDVGLGVKRAFTILRRQTTDKNLNFALGTMEQEVIFKGLPISVSMKRYPKMFDDFYVNLVRAGEVTGKMGEAFNTCANFLERDISLQKRIAAAMTYPIVVLLACVALVLGLCLFVMPTFVALFEGMNMTLPIMTKLLITLVKAIRNPWFDFLAVVFCIFLLNSFRVYYATVQGKKLVDTSVINSPLIGDLMRKVLVTRFSWTMAGLISAGISVMEALKTSEMVITNAYMREQIEKARLGVVQGKSLKQAFDKIDVLPRMFKDLIMVGEETGNLSDQLKKIGDFYDMEIQHVVESFSSIMEPVLIMFMGIVVGFIVVSLFLPIYQIVQQF